MTVRALVSIVACCSFINAADYRVPAGTDTTARRPGGVSVLPGGRKIQPLGRQFATGPGSFGLVISPSGKRIVTADGGPNRYSLTFVERDNSGQWKSRALNAKRRDEKRAEGDEDDWQSVFQGLAFEGEDALYAAEGNSGRVRLIEAASGKRKAIFDLNQGGFADSYSGDLAIDQKRGLLYVLDQANFRLAVFETKTQRLIGNVRVGRLPFAMAMAPDGKRVYVTNVGMFEYTAVPGADRKQAKDTGLPFPAFGFPSRESREGVERQNAAGKTVRIAPLGDPNVVESNSLAIVNVEDGAKPRIEKVIRTGLPFGGKVAGGSSPSGVLATKDSIYVSNTANDSVSLIDARGLTVEAEIPIRIPGLEALRGVMPMGLVMHEASGSLLVAEAGLNAIGVIDLKQRKHIGHIPAAWFPTKVALDGANVIVAHAKGFGTGPNATTVGPLDRSFQGELRRGAVTVFPFPARDTLAAHTADVLMMAGLVPAATPSPAFPKEIKHVVLIVKENRTFDEVFGDMDPAANGAVRGAPTLARFGRYGEVKPTTGLLQPRLTQKSYNVAPNHRALAQRFAYSDNFYADSEVSVDGHHWLVGAYPNAWTESTLMAAYGGQKDFRLPTMAPGRYLFTGSNSSVHPEEQPEAGVLWHHLERFGVSFRNYGEGFELAGADEGKDLEPTGARFLTNVPMPDPLYRNTARDYPNYNMNIPDQFRADQFIADVQRKFVNGGEPFPQLIFIHLPNDHGDKPRTEDGYPFEASYMCDNDYALGRMVEFLSHLPQWKNMAILVTEDDAQGGVDHIDSHRTVLLAISPYAKRNYVSRTHSSFPGFLKSAFRMLGLPPLNLFDATAADLADCFTTAADFTPYSVLPVHADLFEPSKVRAAAPGRPSPRMDDPREVKRQHER